MTQVRDRLQGSVDGDLGDYLDYRIGKAKKELTNAPGSGARFPCEAMLIGKVYAKFHIDVGWGDAAIGEPESLTGDDLLDFAGIGPARPLAISTAQQFAEKAHASTFPWGTRRNTRTKDLVDVVLLIERGGLDAEKLPDGVKVNRVRFWSVLEAEVPRLWLKEGGSGRNPAYRYWKGAESL